MADLMEKDSSQSVKITGSDAAGAETNYVNADSNGNLKVIDAADGTAGSAVPSSVTQVGGSDGTNLRALKTDNSGSLQIGGTIIQSNVLVPYNYDNILASYPSSTQEVYEYRTSTTVVATITVTYTNSSKSTISSIVRT